MLRFQFSSPYGKGLPVTELVFGLGCPFQLGAFGEGCIIKAASGFWLEMDSSWCSDSSQEMRQ